MKKIYKKENTFVSDNTPGIAGILYTLLTYIVAPVVVVATICFVVNFACQFAGVDFDAFLWVEEFIAGLPALVESMTEFAKEMLRKVVG